jgi:CheY-like chemotaxis protein
MFAQEPAPDSRVCCVATPKQAGKKGLLLTLHQPGRQCFHHNQIVFNIGSREVKLQEMARILTADDDSLLLSVIEEWLSSEGHAVDAVCNGNDCRGRLQSESYDLIILDWDLPDVTGIDLLKSFRDSGGTTPILMLTGRRDIDDKTLGFDLGADDYLTKPFQPKELSSRVKALLRRTAAKGPKALGVGNEQLLSDGGLLGTALAAKYEFVSVLGEGAAGLVYKARHPQLEKLLAIKMLHYYGMNPEIYARFEREAVLVSRLNHPHIAAIYDYGVTERNRPFMVMEYVEGNGLDQIIRQRDHVPFKEALNMFSQVCDAMSHAHERGIVHRDLKPSNIMINQKNSLAKVLDFGCGKLRDLYGDQSSALTKDGHSLGTPSYMSPEQVRGIAVDERSDIYSLGCVLYEAITGYVLHLGENPAQTMLKHLEESVPKLADMNPALTIPVELEELVAKALHKEVDQRYQSMLELSKAIDQVLLT